MTETKDMDPGQLISHLNSISVGDLDVIRDKLDEAREACEAIRQPDLADKLREAAEALNHWVDRVMAYDRYL